MPSAPVEVERSCQDSQDYLAALLGLSSPESTARELEYAPLSLFSQDILYQLENDPSLFNFDQTSIPTPDPALTSPNPPTSEDQCLRTSPTVGFVGVGGRSGVQLEDGVTVGSPASQSKKRSAEQFMGQRKKLATGSIPSNSSGLNSQTGRSAGELLKAHFDHFSRKNRESEAVNRGERVAYPDPSLKIVMTRSRHQAAVVIRILDASKVLRLQPIQHLNEKYRFLLRYLDAHCEDSLKMSTVLRRDQLAPLFGWIDEKIHGSGTGPALIGMSTSSELAWKKDDKFDHTQTKLITYFSQALTERGVYVPTLATCLVEEFRAHFLSNLSDNQGGISKSTAIPEYSRHSEAHDQYIGTTNSSLCYSIYPLKQKAHHSVYSSSSAIHKSADKSCSSDPVPKTPFNSNQEFTDLDHQVDVYASTIVGEGQSIPKINSNQMLQHNSPPYNMQVTIPQYLGWKNTLLCSIPLPRTATIDNLQIIKDSLRNFSQANSEFKIRGKSGRITYPGLNIGMFRYIDEPSVKVFKVLNASKYRTMQKTPALISLHKCLLQKMYMYHHQLLNYSKIPESQHNNHHKRLLKWLEVKILNSSSGPPILGKRNSKRLVWEENDKYYASQIVLIEYLSQGIQKKHELAIKTAKSLLEIFLSQDKSEFFDPS
ncbi:hypothetical protein MJO29_009487 [Puccinia striiformis f. sp. tritici]|nr:hypothetical protein MJO29_009487 [Puccinia striiformis f. sp. tritici]